MEKERKHLQELYTLASGYQISSVLFEALRLGIFSAIGERSVSLKALAERVKVSETALKRFLGVLQALGLIECSGNRYGNAQLAGKYLSQHSMTYCGDLFIHNETLMRPWSQLHQCLKKGSMLTPPGSVLKEYPQQLRRYLLSMHAAGRIKSALISRAVPMKNYHCMLDVGGGMGTYAAAFSQINKNLSATVYDLQPVVPHAKRYIRHCGLEARVHVVAGECLAEPFPAEPYDLVFISNVLHMYAAAEVRKLIKKAAKTLVKKGTLLIHDYIAGTGNPVAVALFDMTMLVGTPAGRCHEQEELGRWMLSAGLSDIKTAEVGGGSSIIFGTRKK